MVRKELHFSRSRLTALLFGIVVVLLVIGCGLSLILFPRWGLKSDRSWSYADCSIKCRKAGFEKKPLLVISMDGFKRSYIDRGIVKTLDRMAKCGTTAQYMYATYPSKTFPNHYAMATGLFPESNGIIDKVLYDKQLSTNLVNMGRVKDARYYNGVPIWNVLERQNITTACLFWVGCEVLINGMQPKYHVKFNKSVSFRERIDQILTWLVMPKDSRPSLIMAYFEEPDYTGHFHRSESEIDQQLQNMDSVLNYLFETLHKMGLLNCINIIILSDHGMQQIKNRYYLDEMIDTEGALFAAGVVPKIYFTNNDTNESNDNPSVRAKIIKTMEKLKCSNKEHYRIYDKRSLPKRYHHSATDRAGDIILDGQLGTMFFESRERDYGIVSDHGYDFILPPMRTIFYARGPNIARNTVLKPFQNIELFNLMAALLGIDSDVPENNGTEGRLNRVLKGIPGKKPQRADPLEECSFSSNAGSEEACESGTSSFVAGEGLCYVSNCSDGYLRSAVILSRRTNQTLALIERVNKEILDTKKSQRKRQSSQFATVSLTVKDVNILKVGLYSDFANGHFADLQNLTLHYAKQYDEVVVVSGPIHDFDDNGIADPPQVQWNSDTVPSHIFRIIFRCYNSEWLPNKFQCKEMESLQALPFILPNVPVDYNCLDSFLYLTTNLARLRDIELLTGLEFFPTSSSSTAEQEFYNDEFALTERTRMPEQIWNEDSSEYHIYFYQEYRV